MGAGNRIMVAGSESLTYAEEAIMATVTPITSCATTSCAFNREACAAYAITVGGKAGSPACGTFISLDARGGLPVAQGHVGACQRLECVHNTDLMCTAAAVSMGGDTASCLSYQAR